MFTGKLAYLNKGHLARKAQSPEDSRGLVQRAKVILGRTWPQLSTADNDQLLSDEYTRSVIVLVKDRLEKLDMLPEVAKFGFERPDYNTTEARNMLGKLDEVLLCESADSSRTLGLK